jgi:hypothetical protein
MPQRPARSRRPVSDRGAASALLSCRCGCTRAQGKLVSETRCLQCETVTTREEAVMELSLEIEQNSSVTACLRNFRPAALP